MSLRRSIIGFVALSFIIGLVGYESFTNLQKMISVGCSMK